MSGLEVRSLAASYGGRSVLRGVSFTAQPGEVLGVFGPNGAGKSTLLKALLGLVPCDGGRLLYDGRALAAADLAYMPQRAELDWDFPAVVGEVVEMGGWAASGPLGALGLGLARPRGLRQAAADALQRLGMAELHARQIGELSGGQRQRVLLARTLVRAGAPVLLLDEPFAAVDAVTERVLWDEIARQAAGGRTVIVVHHALAQHERFDRVLLLGGRGPCFGTPREVLSAAHLQAAYGAPMPAAIDGDDDARRTVHRTAA